MSDVKSEALEERLKLALERARLPGKKNTYFLKDCEVSAIAKELGTALEQICNGMTYQSDDGIWSASLSTESHGGFIVVHRQTKEEAEALRDTTRAALEQKAEPVKAAYEEGFQSGYDQCADDKSSGNYSRRVKPLSDWEDSNARKLLEEAKRIREQSND